MNNLVLDERTLSALLTQVETVAQASRVEIDNIVGKYKVMRTYDELSKSKDMVKLYGDCADDYSKLCFAMQGAVEAIMDLKQVKNLIIKDSSGLVPSMVKSYKYRVDTLIEQLQDLRESGNYAKSGMEARVRYLSSITYTSYNKAMGAQC